MSPAPDPQAKTLPDARGEDQPMSLPELCIRRPVMTIPAHDHRA